MVFFNFNIVLLVHYQIYLTNNLILKNLELNIIYLYVLRKGN